MTTINIVHCNYSNTAHLHALSSLVNAYIADEMGGGKRLSEVEQLHLVDGLNNHPKAIVLLAECDNIYCGLLVAFENFSTFSAMPMINIHDIIVLKTFRKKGIGRRLMNAVIEHAERTACNRISLEVRKDNAIAQNLYRSLGFKETQPEMFYWRKMLDPGK
jgi:ribosomal protein S18 acetylase RimI-like enzyme